MEPIVQNDLPAAEPVLAQANLARIRGNWNEAIEMCVRVLRSHPGNSDAHSLLGDIHRDQGATEDAIQWYRMATDLRPAGPDAEKLRKIEQERDRQTALSGPLTTSIAAGAYASGGTTELMGVSPKRWLNSLTIISACFLVATILALILLRTSAQRRPDNLPRTLELSSHPSMPTADSGVDLPVGDPNRASVLPPGEQPRAQQRPHQTGDGLAPDRPDATRTTHLPAFAPPPGTTGAAQEAPPQIRELPPAPVQIVRPLNTSVSVGANRTSESPERLSADQIRQRDSGAIGPDTERAGDEERAANSTPGTTAPASANDAGDQSSDRTPLPER